MTPSELRTQQTLAFIVEVLGARQRVLEVGCGRGELARALAARGLAVTALDLALPDPQPAPNVSYVELDFFAFKAPPFDAVLFTSSLHHIAPLENAIVHATELLAPGGVLVVDDFDLERPDPGTLQWYYDTQELLAAAGLYDLHRVDAGTDVVARWRDAHAHDPPLHTGVEMRTAIAARLDSLAVRPAPYLYRYIAKGLPDDERGGAIAAHVLATEEQRIADGSFSAVGLRIVAA